MEFQRVPVNQLTSCEQRMLLSRIRGTPQWKKTSHLFEKMFNRKIALGQVFESIQNAELVEYRFNDSFRRVLLHGNVRQNDHVLCAVVDLDNETIVTAYWKDFATIKGNAFGSQRIKEGLLLSHPQAGG